MSSRPIVVFDGDDTLWATEWLYDQARTACGRLVQQIGLDAKAWEERQQSLDLARAHDLGVALRRFPGSCLMAAELEAQRLGRRLTATKRFAIYARAASVFTRRAPVIPGAREALEELSTHCELVLLTRGAAVVQRRRLRQSGLGGYFSRILMVPEKTSTTFAVAIQHAPPETCMSVGNSAPSDINPALELGMSAILLTAANVWAFEDREEAREPLEGRRVYESLDIVDVPKYVDKWLAELGRLAA